MKNGYKYILRNVSSQVSFLLGKFFGIRVDVLTCVRAGKLRVVDLLTNTIKTTSDNTGSEVNKNQCGESIVSRDSKPSFSYIFI